MDLINENKLGVTKGTALEEDVKKEFRGETYEVGVYLAMARQAQREGLPEVAEVLKAIAWEEAGHAARFAELNGMISDTKSNLEKMLNGEIEANNGKKEAAKKAKEAGLDEAHDILDESSRDEARHARALQGLLKRYF
ncbi:rubrerythrin [Thermacetogenium phaeum DSM 12270]|uniref:Rubrerythrin n=1 Tax=Thermacetogenium phaeum (strain ATCC BAA-254 / DSM 26808 / PB) TaxID=1089553 RepID=K4LJQ2_THEPS|nr:ferritin family protein [Thermacetogenium phaeum]AFV12185.1 rubrerythrin [Thermacetogenium phaeum DSM 12270]